MVMGEKRICQILICQVFRLPFQSHQTAHLFIPAGPDYGSGWKRPTRTEGGCPTVRGGGDEWEPTVTFTISRGLEFHLRQSKSRIVYLRS